MERIVRDCNVASLALTISQLFCVFLISNREPWPLDGMTFDTLKEQNAKRNLEDLEIEYGKHPEHDQHQYPIIMAKSSY